MEAEDFKTLVGDDKDKKKSMAGSRIYHLLLEANYRCHLSNSQIPDKAILLLSNVFILAAFYLIISGDTVRNWQLDISVIAFILAQTCVFASFHVSQKAIKQSIQNLYSYYEERNEESIYEINKWDVSNTVLWG